MTDRGPSATALGVAFLRAAHQLLDDPPRILDDPVVLRLLGEPTLARVHDDRARLQTPGARALRAHVVTRSRYAEDRLAAAVLEGVRQYVVLGAGLDTFAFRQPAWAHALRIWELDHGASQRAKRERLAAVGLEPPANLAFVDVDFETEALADSLLRAGVALGSPVFLSWLGVTMYLSEDAVDAVFRTISALAPGSELVFSFAPREWRDRGSDGGPSLAERAAALGEPWRTFLAPDALDAKLRGFGFTEVHFLTPAEAETRYFAGRRDGLPAPRRVSVASASV